MIEEHLISIGHINTPYIDIKDCPNNVDFNGPTCQLVIKNEYVIALSGLQTGQDILLLYWLENTDRSLLVQKKSVTNERLGTFAIRSPHRPNPIGVAVLPIEKIENGVVYVRGLDCINGTQLLDIKPAIKKETST